MIRKNLFSILVSLLLLYLSLANSGSFDKLEQVKIPYIDKIAHFGMYFIMMSVILLEHKKSLRNRWNLFLFALIPLAYGILMEILQLLLTSSRSGDFYDAVADAAGVFASVSLWLILKPSGKEKLSDGDKL